MEQLQCPNCGKGMIPFRNDRQLVGRRAIRLRWSICQHCRHVGLTHWEYEDTRPAEPVIEVERVPRRAASERAGVDGTKASRHSCACAE